ncbi:dihydrofolate reductase family protein [Mucilaginibacter sp.]|jgi:dihydrofolate reductase|uniref:dihydrofolate reductase family protein n=1 Tax=Mucilaginibacter sp. TaxID=1882438 RepID=UPI0035672612
MRKLILSMQVTLDGFIEGADGDMSWMVDDKEQWDDLFEMLADVDLFLLGRGMFKDYRDYWKGALAGQKASESEVKYAKLAEKTQHIVFSKTLHDPQWDNTRIVDTDIVAEVNKLKQAPGKSMLTFGGAKLAATLVDAGLIDEYQLVVNPVILTKGKSFFQQLTNRRKLELINVKQLDSGVAILRYKQV